MPKTRARPKKPLLIVVSGPSGVGKSTLVHAATERRKFLRFIPGVTTRPPEHRKGGEQAEHVFLSEKKFVALKKRGGFLETDRFLQFHYGTARRVVDTAINAKKIPVLVIDVQGHAKIRRLGRFRVRSVFVTTKNLVNLRERLLRRHPEMNRARLQKRLREARTAIKHRREYSRVLINPEGRFRETLKQLLDWIDRQSRLR